MIGSAVPSRARIRSRLGSCSAARKTSHVASDAKSAADSTPSFASSSCTPRKAASAIRSEIVKPIPAIAPATRDGDPAHGRPQPAGAQLRHDPGRAGDPDRLADDVTDEDPECDRRGVRVRRKPPLIAIPAFASAKSGTIT